MEAFTSHLTKTFIALIVVILVDLAIELLIINRINNKRKRLKAKVVTRNILIGSLLFFLVKIWVEGFVHLLALLGFIAAALTITQKENILNLTGGLIIMWRHTFSEGDLISIVGNTGIVKQLGVFYFVIEEVVAGTIHEKTGKVIKVPNSFISLHPFMIYEFDQFVFVDRTYYFSFQSDLTKLELCARQVEKSAAQQMKEYHTGLAPEERKELQKLMRKHNHLPIVCDLNIVQNHHKGYRLRIMGHCPVKQEYTFYHFLDALIIEQAKAQHVRLLE